MSWRIAGSYFETCSCDVVCPCTASLSLGATNDYCRVVLVFGVKEGEVEGVDVSGLTVAAVADTPKVMTDGNLRFVGSTQTRPTSRRRSSAACSRACFLAGRWKRSVR